MWSSGEFTGTLSSDRGRLCALRQRSCFLFFCCFFSPLFPSLSPPFPPSCLSPLASFRPANKEVAFNSLWLFERPSSSSSSYFELNTQEKTVTVCCSYTFFSIKVCLDSSGGADHVLRGELRQPSLQHHEELPVHGCQPAALQTGKNSCAALCVCVCVYENFSFSQNL